MTVPQLRAELRRLANPKRAKTLQWFFKTDPGGYGEGDVFLGLTVPVLRRLSRRSSATDPRDVLPLLTSGVHEERLLALFVLVRLFQRGDAALRRQIYDLYLAHTRYISNWDLVDASARDIAGVFLLDRSRRPLYRLARSRSLWERRIAIVATHAFIRAGDVDDTMKLATILLRDDHDLIHKAVGWMLREAGKKDLAALDAFLCEHCRVMPRTMLRYAIERMPEATRRAYMTGAPPTAKAPQRTDAENERQEAKKPRKAKS